MYSSYAASVVMARLGSAERNAIPLDVSARSARSQSCISAERARYKLPSRGKVGQSGCRRVDTRVVRGPPRRSCRSSPSPRAVKTTMPATQSGSACLPEHDETSRTPPLMLLLLHACGIYADGTEWAFTAITLLRPHSTSTPANCWRFVNSNVFDFVAIKLSCRSNCGRPRLQV